MPLPSTASILSSVLNRYRHAPEPFWAMASQVLTSAANFLTSMILIRSIGLIEFGRFSICFLLIMMTRKFLIFVVLTPMSSIMPSIANERLPDYRFFLYLLATAFALVSSLVLIGPVHLWGLLLNAPWLPSLALSLFAANSLANLTDFSRRLLLDCRQPISSFAIDALRFTLQLALMIAFAVLARDQLSADLALWFMAAGSLAGLVLSVLLTHRLRPNFRLVGEFWSRHHHYTGWNSVSTILETIQSTAPLLIASAVLGEATTGTLRAIQQFANLLNLPFNALLQVLPSMASRRYATRGLGAMNALLTKVTLVSSAGIVALSLAILLASDFVLRQALKLETGDAIPIFIAYMVLNVCMLIRLPTIITCSVLSVPRAQAAASVIGAILATAGTYLLLFPLGPIAAPVVNAVSLLVTTLLTWHNMRPRLHQVRA
ncbi:lipopolysaccharide biosynthesis protein [Novosphingobium decolorationis]|uniref:O-antigen/teichoic acid export membrane protein n=1 Tax=Novosphingobium decolorationis TaxID=2698673 RepID=A0ABX8E663_9SPHN|nr:hypothetical protein [Novosphingobium decolorationis]QVM83705.1 hypothetical protein HT578_08345 [Novosphingobium decolorationis]